LYGYAECIFDYEFLMSFQFNYGFYVSGLLGQRIFLWIYI
jgi:hypothetical protein